MGPALKGQDRVVARLFVAAGAVLFFAMVIGVGIGWTSVVGPDRVQVAINVWIAGFVIAFLLFLSGLGYGLVRAKGIGGVKGEVVVMDTKIVAVTALNPNMEPIWNEETFSEDEIKRYVHLRYPDGGVVELRIDKRLLDYIGEGMKGNATILGDWMVTFEPTGI